VADDDIHAMRVVRQRCPEIANEVVSAELFTSEALLFYGGEQLDDVLRLDRVFGREAVIDAGTADINATLVR
jgi:hypothetical protein